MNRIWSSRSSRYSRCQRLLHLHDHLGHREDLVRRGGDAGTGGAVGLVVDADARTGTGLDRHLMAVQDQLAHARGDQAHPVLVRLDLLGHADQHASTPCSAKISGGLETTPVGSIPRPDRARPPSGRAAAGGPDATSATRWPARPSGDAGRSCCWAACRPSPSAGHPRRSARQLGGGTVAAAGHGMGGERGRLHRLLDAAGRAARPRSSSPRPGARTSMAARPRPAGR